MNKEPALLRVLKDFLKRSFLGALLQFTAICLSAAGLIWILSADARREIDAMVLANGDSVQWSLAQSEVEYSRYLNALKDVLLEEEDAAVELVRRFNIFYSRVETIGDAASFAGVRTTQGISESLEAIRAHLDAAIPFVDDDIDAINAAVPDLLAEARALSKHIRAISLAGVRTFALESQTRRESVARALLDLGVIMFFMLVAVFAAVAIQLRMMRAAKRQTAEIVDAQNRLRSIVSASLDGILAIDRYGKVLEFNAAAERIFGYSRAEAIGADMAKLIVPDHLYHQHEAGMARYLETGEKRVVGKGLVKLEARDKSGRIFPVEFSISSAETPAGEIFVSFIRDISDRVRAEHELIEARDKAVAGEKAKADLLAVMSHEMRTPLNGVLGTLQLLKPLVRDEDQMKLLDTMDHSGQLLLEHVNNVLDISRIDAGMAEAHVQEFKPKDVIESVANGLRTQLKERGNALEVRETGRPVGIVAGDHARLRQIMFNLIGNANKFTENGNIAVEIELVASGDLIVFRVADTGIGISKEDQQRIFDDFITLDTSYGREFEGTGLGLGIVNRLVGLLNGEITVESEVGKGSTFTVKLPVQGVSNRVTSGMSQHQESPSEKHDLDVLVVEDNDVNRMIIRMMLEQIGCSVTEANDGQQGIDAAAEQTFDLILMDISMPTVDGLAATESIRASKGPNADTRIVALTAHAFAADIERFHSAGVAEVLTKPLVREELLEVLRQAEPKPNVTKSTQAIDELVAALGPKMARAMQEKVKCEIESGLKSMHKLLDAQIDRSEITKLAHKLAGSAGFVGLERLRVALVEVENSGRDIAGDELLALLRTIEQEIDSAPPI